MTLRIVLNTADSFRSSAKTKGEKFGSVAPLPVNYPTTVFKNRQSCLRKLVFGDHHPINKPVKLSTQAKKKGQHFNCGRDSFTRCQPIERLFFQGPTRWAWFPAARNVLLLMRRKNTLLPSLQMNQSQTSFFLMSYSNYKPSPIPSPRTWRVISRSTHNPPNRAKPRFLL